jgi:S-sulfo-L-cysteine synthase (O-acetyl-L-serine-dependent)
MMKPADEVASGKPVMLTPLYQTAYRPTPLSARPQTQAQQLEDLIGHTPLLDLAQTARVYGLSRRVSLLAKAEWFNPGGSVKDRAALHIIRTAEQEGKLRPGMTLLDSTSGNTGIAYAMLGAARGYRVLLTVPKNVSPERLAILRAYGAELLFTDPMDGSDGALLEARRLAEADPTFFYARQYDNPANWQAHYLTTANEIWGQTNGTLTHFVAGMGTSGTFVGTMRRLKELNPAIMGHAVQPDSPFNGLEGLKHMATAVKPTIYEPDLADNFLMVRTEEAYDMARFLVRQEGIFVGLSAAAAVAASITVGQGLEAGTIVTVLPDSGFKYLSERFWNKA